MVRLFKAKPSKIVDWKMKRSRYGQYRKRIMPLRVKVEKLVQAQKAIEVKFLDTLVNFLCDATAEVQPAAAGSLVVIPQNDTDSGREGRKVIVKSLELKMQATFNDAVGAVQNAGIAYIYLVQDTQANGAIPAVTGDAGIFTATFSGFPGLFTKQLANEGRFRILRKYVFELNPGIGTSGAALQQMVLFKTDYIKLNVPITYDASAATGALATIRSNNLFLVSGSDGTTDDRITVNISSRIRFTDE